ncbi:hypothetical protein SpCBS45565_g03888 [Spizellomyces sp. 'palustris']|nr:hypothetical protein SpCBS45565_g03888 [Spizellomyces sp. 'palustris']
MLATPTITKQHITPSTSHPPPSQASSKRKLPPALAPPPPAIHADVATNTKVYTIINALREKGEALSEKEIMRLTAVHIGGTPGLREILRTNLKIEFIPQDKTYRYKPKYTIRSKEDLITLLQSNASHGGMEIKELLDSWSGLLGAVQELEKEGHVLVLKTKDQKPRIVYWNDKSLNLDMSKEFQNYWHEIQLPKESDLAKELERAGLKSMEVFVAPKATDKPKESKRRGHKRIKLTNTHLEGLDILGPIK